jgi:hypothetical protein
MAAPQEFVIRASGADKAATKHLVARFPLAFRPDPRSDETANAPELKGTGEWVMGQMEQAEAKPGTRGLPGQWVLEEQSRGRPRFVGQPEGGLRDTGAGYFLLMKGKGNEFIAVPVSDMFTFKPALQRRHQTLEEAEAAMQAQRLQHERANPRLAKAVARDEGKLGLTTCQLQSTAGHGSRVGVCAAPFIAAALLLPCCRVSEGQ